MFSNGGVDSDDRRALFEAIEQDLKDFGIDIALRFYAKIAAITTWKCKYCTYVNDADKLRCEACEALSDGG